VINILHMCAKNDINGNPQRLYVMSNEDGKYIAAWDEGYMGCDAVPGPFRKDAYLSQRFDVSVTEYKKLLRTLPHPEFGFEVEGYSHLR
jgi:hypothetical protein